MNEPFKTLIEAAILAPSGDNTQPWRFLVDETASTIGVQVDDTRDTSPMNADQRMARIACGGAIENIDRTARHNGWPCKIHVNDAALNLAEIVLSRNAHGPGIIEEVLKTRQTNRNPYEPSLRSMPPLVTLGQIQQPEGVEVVAVSNGAKSQIAELIGIADEAMFQAPTILRSFLHNIRTTRPTQSVALDGLPIGTLGLNAVERVLFPHLEKVPEWLVRTRLFGRGFRRKGSGLANSSAGLCIFLAADNAQKTDVAVGITLQRIWLRLEEWGLSAQPMMSLPVLESMCQNGLLPDHVELTQKLSRRVLELLGTSNVRIAAILRFGKGTPAKERTQRRPAPLASENLPACLLN